MRKRLKIKDIIRLHEVFKKMPQSAHFIIDVKEISCTHPNAETRCIGGAVTVEELVDYCPDCGAKWNYRVEC